MLRITVPISPEGWDEKKQMFVEPKFQTLQLEHSLVSLSKWESKYCKPFISTKDKTYEESLDYIKFMTLNPSVNPEVYDHITMANMQEINAYIDSPMTATTFSNDKTAKKNREIITAELIYYWMVALNIPFECQKWHLNRLLTLVRVCEIKNTPPKKKNKRDTAKRYAAMNAARKKQLNTKG